MKYAKAKHDEWSRQYLYNIYMSETLRLSVEGKMLNARYVDLLQHKPIDTRTGDEIALDIIERLDIKVN